jgi:hypothetical protein
LPFNTQWIIMVNVVFGNSRRLLVARLSMHSPNSVASCRLHYLPFFLAS